MKFIAREKELEILEYKKDFSSFVAVGG